QAGRLVRLGRLAVRDRRDLAGAVAAVVAHPVDVHPVGGHARGDVDLEADGVALIRADVGREALDLGRVVAAEVPLCAGVARLGVLAGDRADGVAGGREGEV